MELMQVKVGDRWVAIPSIIGPKGDSGEVTQAEFDELSNNVSDMRNATDADIGKALSPKTVIDGVVTEWQYVEGGSGGGGGGGGGSSTVVMVCTNTTGWSANTFAKGAHVTLSLNWSSIDDGIPTGDGSLTVAVGTSSSDLINRSVIGVAQGDISVDISEWLHDGINFVKLTVTDADGNIRNKTFTIQIENVFIESTFDPSYIHTGAITFPYTPWGEFEKTIHFSIDGTEQESVVTSVSGRQLTYILPAQSHGDHSIAVWMTGTIGGTSVTSNTLRYDIICTTSGSNSPVISTNYRETEVMKYATVVIPYMVFSPRSQVSAVTISLNGTVVQDLPSVDRTMQEFSYRFDETGVKTIVIACGATSKTITITVTESDIDVEAVTENLGLYLSSHGRSNGEQNPGVWTYGTGVGQISCNFSGFNFVSDGWMQDEDGITVLRITGDATLTIPYKLFSTDFRQSGKTIEIEFATRNVRNYSDVLIDCMSGGRGLRITAQNCALASEQTRISTQFKEDEHVRVGFVVDKRAGMRLVRIYLNGIISGVVQYPVNDNFSQVTPVDITIHGANSTIDLYCVRVYDMDLTAQQMEENWIADTQDGRLMEDRYRHNHIRDAYGKIVTSMLPADLPYMILRAAELPQYKGDKKTVSGSYINPINTSKSFTFEGAQADVQGTSSQYYTRKNYKIKFKNGFVMEGGTTVSKYAMRDDSIPVNTFTFKADVASSEGANNVELARLYDEACPYETPAQRTNSKVRQGIDGFPIVIFWQNTTNNETNFLGKYNFNNDKGTEEVFGFVEEDESWEILNNTSDRVIWKSADYAGDDWLNDFEARYPDTDPAYTDKAQLAEFAAWIVSTDPDQATNDILADSVEYNGVVYTNDTAAYRKAKFKAELGKYVEVDSALFYYLFTELFLMVDSRAKNAFPSFIGTEVVQE